MQVPQATRRCDQQQSFEANAESGVEPKDNNVSKQIPLESTSGSVGKWFHFPECLYKLIAKLGTQQ